MKSIFLIVVLACIITMIQAKYLLVEVEEVEQGKHYLSYYMSMYCSFAIKLVRFYQKIKMLLILQEHRLAGLHLPSHAKKDVPMPRIATSVTIADCA